MQSPSLRGWDPRFAPLARGRGTQFWLERAVELDDVTENRAAATVRVGDLPYRVAITSFQDPAAATYRCGCRPVTGHNSCAHVYAALLALDELLVELGDAPASAASARPGPSRRSDWRQRLETLADPRPPASAPVLEYYVELEPVADALLSIDVRERVAKNDGRARGTRTGRLSPEVVAQLPEPDRTLVRWARRDHRSHYHSGHAARDDFAMSVPWRVASFDAAAVLPLLARTQRVFRGPVPTNGAAAPRLEIDVEVPFELRIVAATDPDDPDVRTVRAEFVRGERALAIPAWVQETFYVLVDDVLVRVECHGGSALANELTRGPLRVPASELQQLIATLATQRGAGRWLQRLLPDLPPSRPIGVVEIGFPNGRTPMLPVLLRFDYDGIVVDEGQVGTGELVAAAGVVRRRDAVAEGALRAQVLAAGVAIGLGDALVCARERLHEVVPVLLRDGLRVLADGRKVRPFHGGTATIGSGIDWFDVDGGAEFDGHRATWPELLRRPATPDGLVELGDGTFGLLPSAWLRRVEAMRVLGGEEEGGRIRVPASRALLLDALLATQGDDGLVIDERFAALRARLRSFTSVQPVDAPAGFAGSLRPYQRDGLGWLRFLRDAGLGGCLADDMGLGKTVQVLAMLLEEHPPSARAAPVDGERAPPVATAAEGEVRTGQRRRSGAGRRAGRRAGGAHDPGATAPPRPRASILVAPRSVLGNWLAEARRFAPSLRVVDFSGIDRWRDGTAERLTDSDVVLTTYALARADAAVFAERGLEFHCAILDEAQAIKNPDSQSSKAVRLLRARHRFALTGTPVENHLGDLWSLFEFTNPGMLGRLPAFRELFARDADAAALTRHGALLQRALRPVLLRRTKAQVLPDLPAKVEQTLWCDLGPEQRRRYDQLAKHYRKQLLAGPGEPTDGQRFLVLEALLRLRQAACHEGLLVGGKRRAESAKFDELLPRLEELAAEGHKALVFSQFTSLLDLLEAGLRARGLAWERLDGRTRDRTRRIERFQTDPACPLFLISLKAGGYGLNLSEAHYVFLLDPWWNPAVEMQAIDRAHRIGQTRSVHAYRLVARGTVEEHVLVLQERKKALCEAILGNERSLLQDLTRADLALLLA